MKLFGFSETARFSKRVTQLLSDDDYAEMQFFFCESPEYGKVIPGGKGLRKLPWSGSGRGKRGGTRVIYYFAVVKEKFLLLDIYAKNEKSDLTKNELKILAEDAERWLQE